MITLSVTLIVIIITVAASLYAWKNPEIYQKWMMNPYRVNRNNEYYRFITSGFIHADYSHLFFNMFSLFFFAQLVENIMGILNFLILYIVGIIISDLPTYFKYKNSPHYNSLGASGGVSSVIFASILLNPLNKIYIFFIPVGIPGFIYGLLFLGFCYYMSKRGGDNINHSAHFYGSVFGIVYTIIVLPWALGNFIEQVKSWGQ
ncbi:MAG TPA: rhomboid family intramembrane serine protease [Cytophagaceae bacterium]|jgi:membrane associated rhomboid family serine protease|nr:rhomboid family intramembrane serine protease [Cytophagaceae bacterium]